MPQVFYSFEGNIGAGKSYFLNKIADCVPTIPEPVEEWTRIKIDDKNILECFYEDMGKYAMSFQLTTLITRFEKFAASRDENVIVERSLKSDQEIFARYFFDKQIIDGIQWAAYKYLNKFLSDQLPPFEYFFIPTSPAQCLENIKKRGRGGEQNIGLDLLQEYDDYHHKAFGKNKVDLTKLICDIKKNNCETKNEHDAPQKTCNI